MQRDVLGDRELEHEAPALAVLGNVADSGIQHLPGARLVQLLVADPNRTALDLRQPRDRVDQLGLAVAVDARDTDDLARVHLERHAAHLLDPAVVADVEVLHGQRDLAGLPRRLVDAQEHLAADHRPRE